MTGITDEMIQKAATALATYICCNPDLWKHYTEHARLALEAAAEPTAVVAPRRWPVGSPEPKEKGLRVQSTQNGVIFRYEFERWCATPGSGGDGHYYSWHAMNSEHAADGMELVEVVSGVAGDTR